MSIIDFSKVRDATAEFQWRRGEAMGGLDVTHRPVYPVDFVEVTGAFPIPDRSLWNGSRIFVVYGTDRSGLTWYAELHSARGSGGFLSMAYTPMADLRWSDAVATSLARYVGLFSHDVRELYLGCVPERLRARMRETGVPI